MFYWKNFSLDPIEVEKITAIYRDHLPNNSYFFQQLQLPVTHFLGREVQRFVLIQVAPHAVGRIHTDFRPKEYGYQLALQIPLDNCGKSITNLWASDETPPTQYTDNGQPYNFFKPELCTLVTSFTLLEPVIWRTDIPHSVDNKSDKMRRAISIRFKEDPWDLVGES